MNTTKTQAYNDAVSTYYKAAQVLANAVARAKVEAGNAWHSAGGCSRCGGRGWIVTWDTLDSLSGCYAEYGSCDNAECTPETRKASGLNPGYYTMYDRNRNVPDPFVLPQHLQVMSAEVANLQIQMESLKLEATLARGKTVRVVRGRKVPRGLEGEVTWYGENQWGPRVGIRDINGTVHWTAASNVEVL